MAFTRIERGIRQEVIISQGDASSCTPKPVLEVPHTMMEYRASDWSVTREGAKIEMYQSNPSSRKK